MSQPRILGGSAKGVQLETPRHGTRPSPSRLREALFDILAFEPRGTFLDLFSGSGAIGLEAASRGWQASCVDISAQAVAVIRRNAERAGLSVSVAREDALAFVARHPASFQVAFAAPPYPRPLTAIFQAVLDAEPVTPGGLYVFQHPSDQTPDLTFPEGWGAARGKRYGSNALTLVRTPPAQPR